VLDPYCAARTVQGYMARFHKVSKACETEARSRETRLKRGMIKGKVLETEHDQGEGA
jgi:hypothetical protein